MAEYFLCVSLTLNTKLISKAGWKLKSKLESLNVLLKVSNFHFVKHLEPV